VSFDLDAWLPSPTVRVTHRRESSVDAASLWEAARRVRLADTRVLGRLVRLRIPGVSEDQSYFELFRAPPFTVLHEEDAALIVGLVGRIWTIRRDYPSLAGPQAFLEWTAPGTARVVFANWALPPVEGGTQATLYSETRVAVYDREARVGLAAVRPLISAFNSLIGSEALSAAVRLAERVRP